MTRLACPGRRLKSGLRELRLYAAAASRRDPQGLEPSPLNRPFGVYRAVQRALPGFL
jgi:hypothetical protein